MNKSSIKNFAVSARVKLMEAVRQEAFEIGVTKNEIKEPEIYQDGFRVNQRFFKKYEIRQRNKLIQRVREKGLDQVIEEVAYTWFNRLIAVRFMEVNEYLPIGVRVLSSETEGKTEPDVIGQVLEVADELDLDLEVVYRLQDTNDAEGLFKYTFIKQCNKLGEIMPVMFEQIEDYTELLLPNQLLAEGSVLRDLVTMIEEDDWKEQVEIIGWLYQYYISEKKDEVFADLKKNKKITKENIPAATQLFTPKWIVKYMVENSLGRLWLESHPNEELKQQWKYYLEEAEQEPDVQQQLEQLRNKQLSPEDIKVLDPCMGSGHILVYAFDVLYQMYLTAGYSERDIPRLILEKNIYGLDIDDRAAQLSYFALMMKARSYNRRIFRKPIELNVCAIQESNGIPKEAVEYFVNPDGLELEKSIQRADVEYLVNVFRDAKEYGSILNVESMDFEAIKTRLEQLKESGAEDLFGEQYRDLLLEKLPSLVKQAEIMSKLYEIVITNPPYMGRRGMNSNLISYLESNYPKSKNDLFAVFIEKVLRSIYKSTYSAIITQHAWMFLDSFSLLREELLQRYTITSMIHLGTKAFEEISGEVVQTTAVVIKNDRVSDFKGSFCRLVDFPNSEEKRNAFLERKLVYSQTKQEEFLQIPNNVVAYWIPNTKIFHNDSLSNYFDSAGRVKTHNNEKFVRFFWEIDKTDSKWVPYANGGGYRKYYGNEFFVVNWSEEAKAYYQQHGGLNNPKYWNKQGITWTLIATEKQGFRIKKAHFQYSSGAPTIISSDPSIDIVVLGFLNSKVATYLLKVLNPTVNTTVNDVLALPFKSNLSYGIIPELVMDNIKIAESDWDDFEVSLDFKSHPLIDVTYNKKANKLEDIFKAWSLHKDNQILKIKENEGKPEL